MFGWQSQLAASRRRPLRAPRVVGFASDWAANWAGKLVIALCLVLLVFLAVAQVAHLHPLESNADHCPLCLALSTAVPIAVLITAMALIRLGNSPRPRALAPVVQRFHSRLYTRPPPEAR